LLCAQWASIYAAELIGFCAFNRYNLKKHADILDYLSVPRSVERIEEVIKIHRLRLKSLRAKGANREDVQTKPTLDPWARNARTSLSPPTANRGAKGPNWAP
jgi:hypothetical protein